MYHRHQVVAVTNMSFTKQLNKIPVKTLQLMNLRWMNSLVQEEPKDCAQKPPSLCLWSLLRQTYSPSTIIKSKTEVKQKHSFWITTHTVTGKEYIYKSLFCLLLDLVIGHTTHARFNSATMMMDDLMLKLKNSSKSSHTQHNNRQHIRPQQIMPAAAERAAPGQKRGNRWVAMPNLPIIPVNYKGYQSFSVERRCAVTTQTFILMRLVKKSQTL